MVSYFEDTRLKNFKHATERYKTDKTHYISIDEDAYHVLCEAKKRLEKNNLPSTDSDAIIYLAMTINTLLEKLEKNQINLDDWI
jgi:hypothetical protein